MHWRGDRSTGPAGTSASDPNISFLNFAPAFQTLIGSATQPSTAQMQAFANFQLQVLPPPNPVRNLDNSLTASQQNGFNFFSGSRPSDGINSAVVNAVLGEPASFTCNGCHTLDPSQGFFGTGGNQSFENLPQIVKIPHLRNLYDKIGMFGAPAVTFYGAADSGNTATRSAALASPATAAPTPSPASSAPRFSILLQTQASRSRIPTPREAPWSSIFSPSIPTSPPSSASR